MREWCASRQTSCGRVPVECMGQAVPVSARRIPHQDRQSQPLAWVTGRMWADSMRQSQQALPVLHGGLGPLGHNSGQAKSPRDQKCRSLKTPPHRQVTAHVAPPVTTQGTSQHMLGMSDNKTELLGGSWVLGGSRVAVGWSLRGQDKGATLKINT